MENQEQKPIPETPITSEQPASPAGRPTKKAKPKWIVPAIIVAGIIILGVGGWFGYNYLLKPAIPEGAIEWQIYKNDEYSIEFKYPQNWNLGENYLDKEETQLILTVTDGVDPVKMVVCPKTCVHSGAEGYNSTESEISLGEEKFKRLDFYYEEVKKLSFLYPKDFIKLGWCIGCNDDSWSDEGRIELRALNEEDWNILNQILSSFKVAKIDEFADWETYKNEEYGFELKYPHNYDFIDYTLLSPKDVSPTELSFDLSAYSIYTSIMADGVCGTIYSGSFQEQKQMFDEANFGSNFDKGFGRTSAMINHSKVFKNKEGIKIVHGISSCQGHVEDDDPGFLQYVALMFNEHMRIDLSFNINNEKLGGVKVKELGKKMRNIVEGKDGSEAQEIYNNFLKTLDSFKLTELGNNLKLKTYRNERDGYEIKYPIDFSVYDDDPNKKIVFVGTNPAHRSPNEGISIRIIDKDILERVKEVKEQDELTAVLFETDKFNFNEIEVYEIIITTPIGYNEAHYLFSKNDKNFEIIWENQNMAQEEILFTFKFLD